MSNSELTFHWVKGELIGKGPHGRVYLALNTTTGEMIAVKQFELREGVGNQDDSRETHVTRALLSESEILGSLDHPNIVQYLGSEQSSGYLNIFTEYVPGGSIGNCLWKYGKFDHDIVRSFTAQILSGLEYLHSRNMMHRALKANNVLIDPSGICKLSDFSFSNVDFADSHPETTVHSPITWMAPELLREGQEYNAKVDIWSLGCVVLEMWTGRNPWEGETVDSIFKVTSSGVPPVPNDVKLDAVEEDFRKQCLALDPRERPTTTELRRHKFLELKLDWIFTGFT